MVRQQTQRRGHRSRQADSVTQHGDSDSEDLVRFLERHGKALEYLAGALDLSKVESKHAAVLRSCESLQQINRGSQKQRGLLKNTQILKLYTNAAVNSMNVVLQGTQGCLFDHSKAAGVVSSLCSSISDCVKLVLGEGSQAHEALQLHLTESGEGDCTG